MNRSPIAQARDLVPLRPLTRIEALMIAEKQAIRLRRCLGWNGTLPAELVLADLPKVEIIRKTPWLFSGAIDWVGGRWVVALNGAEPLVRQRFSLAHEIKHIIDYPDVKLIYSGIKDENDRMDYIEQVCNYFAGCLLVPRPLLKRIWSTETQNLRELAAIFHVSQAAMKTRLHQVGLGDPIPRCAPAEKFAFTEAA